jgi:hypothetical protein
MDPSSLPMQSLLKAGIFSWSLESDHPSKDAWLYREDFSTGVSSSAMGVLESLRKKLASQISTARFLQES